MPSLAHHIDPPQPSYLILLLSFLFLSFLLLQDLCYLIILSCFTKFKLPFIISCLFVVMAELVNLIVASALVVLLMFCYGITSTEERVLKEHENHHNLRATYKYGPRTIELRRNLVVKAVNDKVRPELSSTSVPYYHTSGGAVDGFRPTDPGHSPGAGHSKGPGSVSPKNEPDLN